MWVYTFAVICTLLFGHSLLPLLSCPEGFKLPEGRYLLCPISPHSAWYGAGAQHLSPACCGQWRRTRQAPWVLQPAEAGGISAGPVHAGSVCSLVQDWLKSFVDQSESMPATDYFWVIIPCECECGVWSRIWKQGHLLVGEMRSLMCPSV